jgi:dihydroxyacetone kinase
VTQAHQSLTLDELYQMIREGAEGVINRGKAEPGDKTMCDVWLPVVESLRQSSEQHLSIPRAGCRKPASGSRSAKHHHHAGAQRPRQLSGRTQHWASGSRRNVGDVYGADAGGSGKVRKTRW